MNQNFSQRNGLEPVDVPLQLTSMDENLRIALWNVLVTKLFGRLASNYEGYVTQEYHVFVSLWRNFFKQPADEFDKYLVSRREFYKSEIMTAEWHRIYDLFEFIAAKMIPADAEAFVTATNQALEQEHSGYRFVEGLMLPVTRSIEVELHNHDHSKIKKSDNSTIQTNLAAAYAALRTQPDAVLVHCKLILEDLQQVTTLPPSTVAPGTSKAVQDNLRTIGSLLCALEITPSDLNLARLCLSVTTALVSFSMPDINVDNETNSTLKIVTKNIWGEPIR